MELYGIVEAILFKNDDNGYTVLKLDTEDEGAVTVTGCMPSVTIGEELALVGQWKTHASYGEQFVVESYESQLPSTSMAMISYLSSGIIKGIGPKLATKLVHHFKDDIFYIMTHEYKRLTEIKGITEKRAEEINSAFLKHTYIRELAEFLAKYSIPLEISARLYKNFRHKVIERISENPYLLCDEEYGVDFNLCDKIALGLNFAENDMKRVQAGTLYTMRFNLQNGHTFIPMEKLVVAVCGLLRLDRDRIEEGIDFLISDNKLVVQDICNENAVYLEDMYYTEILISAYLKKLCERTFSYDIDILELIENLEENNNIKYAPLQKEAIKQSAENGICILTGGPGTGKTTTVKGMITLFEALGLETVLAAPTGRAAKRMSELCNVSASTIHRLLEATRTVGGDVNFQKNSSNPIRADVIILDEVSMLDINLIRAVLDAMEDETRLVLVGDYDQLPPVGPGNFLRDIIKSDKINVISLNEIFRQEKQSMIVVNAHKVNKGEVPQSSGSSGDFFIMKKRDNEALINTVVELCASRLPDYYGIKPSQIQVISPSRKQGTGTIVLNRFLQQRLNPESDNKTEKRYGETVFRTGDRVMQIHNNYDIVWTKKDTNEQGMGIFNGDIGEILSVNPSLELMEICFEDKICMYNFDMLSSLDLAYAITTHKSQGSEFEAVVFAASNNISKRLLTRNILYTAITRAKTLLVIVCGDETVEFMVSNNTKNKRYSALKTRLQKDG